MQSRITFAYSCINVIQKRKFVTYLVCILTRIKTLKSKSKVLVKPVLLNEVTLRPMTSFVGRGKIFHRDKI